MTHIFDNRLQIHTFLFLAARKDLEELIEPLKCKKGEKFLLYKKNHLPVRYHYGGSPRIGDVLISGKPGKAVFLLVIFSSV